MPCPGGPRPPPPGPPGNVHPRLPRSSLGLRSRLRSGRFSLSRQSPSVTESGQLPGQGLSGHSCLSRQRRFCLTGSCSAGPMGLEDGSCHRHHRSPWALCSGDAVTMAWKGDQPQLRAEGAEWGQTLAPVTQRGLQRVFRERAWPVLPLTSRDSGPAKPGQLPGRQLLPHRLKRSFPLGLKIHLNEQKEIHEAKGSNYPRGWEPPSHCVHLSVCPPINTLGPAPGEAGIQLDHSPAEQRPASEGCAPEAPALLSPHPGTEARPAADRWPTSPRGHGVVSCLAGGKQGWGRAILDAGVGGDLDPGPQARAEGQGHGDLVQRRHEGFCLHQAEGEGSFPTPPAAHGCVREATQRRPWENPESGRRVEGLGTQGGENSTQSTRETHRPTWWRREAWIPCFQTQFSSGRWPEWDWCQQRGSEHPDPWPRRGPCLGPLFVPQA